MIFKIFDTFYFPFYFRRDDLDFEINDEPTALQIISEQRLHPVMVARVDTGAAEDGGDVLDLVPFSTSGAYNNDFSFKITCLGVYKPMGLKHASFVYPDQINVVESGKVDGMVNNFRIIGQLQDMPTQYALQKNYQEALEAQVAFEWVHQ